ncbi:RND family efflux transporter MFP subunit [Desulfosalsimonas propionicica]|uniref:RND family efflux transporter MFP subunit n=1 Tax=Desulfosalsimonas propionicica TaxID=332175 RepID=A0A7W0C8L3_9BACT|nr:efflux RND transporter periplasmic adaptor subunit [Desulfosalsimonas propionicica]MBA2881173.1 RND family efflux transporter MFP subunit [Desulfosalsimonas propionicica]
MTQKIRIIVHGVLALAIIAGGAAGYLLLKSVRQAPGRQEVQPPLPIVRTVPVSIGELDMTLSGEGTVRPLAEVQLVPQVSGRVVEVSPDLVNGGSFEKGELMLRIEDADYEIAVTQARAGLQEARSNYQSAVEDSAAAVSEWQNLHPDTPPPPLVAKKPQLEAARAQLEAQRAGLEKARLDLARTRIYAPFDCRVSSEQVDEGQYIAPGQALATVYATAAVEIVVPMESSALQWFDVPGFTTEHKQGSPAAVTAGTAGVKIKRNGRVVRAQGKIDENTRMVSVVIRVDDPFATNPPLAPGQFAEVAISGRNIRDAAIIPRAALRDQDTVWAVDPKENRLYIRKIDLAYLDSRGAVVRSGLNSGEHVAVSVLKAVTDGMKVQNVETGRKDTP